MATAGSVRTIKVVVGGEGNVGKTSLIRRCAKAKFSEARNITLGSGHLLSTTTFGVTAAT